MKGQKQDWGKKGKLGQGEKIGKVGSVRRSLECGKEGWKGCRGLPWPLLVLYCTVVLGVKMWPPVEIMCMMQAALCPREDL